MDGINVTVPTATATATAIANEVNVPTATMIELGPLRLELTAVAIREYDKAGENLMAANMVTVTLDELHTLVSDLDKAELKVKEAFAEDTKDRNSKQNAMRVSPDGSNGWLRRMLRDCGYDDCVPTVEQRQGKGWGW